MKKYVWIVCFLCVCGCLFLGSCTGSPDLPKESDTDTTAVSQGDTSIPDQDVTDGTTEDRTEDTTEATTEPAPDIKSDGSFSTDRYDVIDVDGQYHISFKNGNELAATESDVLSQEIGYLAFASIDEMYDALRNDKLTEAQIAVIKNAFTKTVQGFVLPNIDALQVPILPQGMQPVGVGMTDDTYTYSIKTEGSERGCGIKLMSESLYDALYLKDYSEFFENNSFPILSTETVNYDVISGEAVTYQTAVTTLKDIRFTIEGEGRTLSVLLTFVLEDTADYLPTSETVPYSVTIYCEQPDAHARIYLYSLEEAPTIAWLSSFGLTDFIPPAEEAA